MADVDRAAIIRRTSEIAGLDKGKSARILEEFERTFAQPFAEKLRSLRMRDIIKNKNPYLYRASGILTCEDLVRRVLQDYVSASAEGYFGKFSEGVARVVSGGIKPVGGGEIDLDVRYDGVAVLYVIKSGPKGFNKSSRTRALQELRSAESKLSQDKWRVEKKVAFAYGRKRTTIREGVSFLSSKQFWAEVSGDTGFYRKLVDICEMLAPLYTADMQAPFDHLLREAQDLFCEDGKVNWDKVLALVSA